MPKNIDGIRKKASNLNHSPHLKVKKHFGKLWLIFIIVVIFATLSGISFIAASAAQPKINALKLFRSGKYLVLFQNNAELRPSGGFIGSFAVVEMSNYKIKKIEFNTNIYKLDKQFVQDHKILPPKPLQNITEFWALRDSNFAASYPESAEKIEWFYNQETNEKVDGVISINASVIRDLLKKVGPVTLTDPSTMISADNFFTELTNQIEKKYYLDSDNQPINEPKTILVELMPEILRRVGKLSKLSLAKFLYQNLQEKQILFYSNDSQIEKGILFQNWGGEIQTTNGDYLTVINANINGEKSSLNVEEKIDYRVQEDSGNLTGNLTLTRSHTGSGIWPDGPNNNWTRILVPKGTILQKAELNGSDATKKIEIAEEAGKISYGIWINTLPGSSNILNLNYQLPIKSKNYQLLLQKQSGNLGDDVSVSFGDKVLFDGVLNEDKVIK